MMGLWVDAHLATDLYAADCKGRGSACAAVSTQTAVECCPKSAFITPDTIWSPEQTHCTHTWPTETCLHMHNALVNTDTKINLHKQTRGKKFKPIYTCTQQTDSSVQQNLY